MALKEYRKKRDFTSTPEPRGLKHDTRTKRTFVIQKHDATRLHYDFRLELDGVLKSWAVPKGPSLDPAEKRLAVQVEDHPVDYGKFEGIIPAGYGKGTVLLWDHGVWIPENDPREGLENGKLKFRLEGEKLRGGWTLVRMGGPAATESKPQWLLIKEKDDEARPSSKRDILKEKPNSISSGRTLKQIADNKRAKQWPSKKSAAKAAKPDAGKIIKAPILRTTKSKKKKSARKSVRGGSSTAKEEGRKAPLPVSLSVQLATLVNEPPEDDRWVHEIKYDGYRLLCRVQNGSASLITRNGKDWTERFAPLAETARRLPVRTAILDGEAVILDPQGVSDFQALQNALSEERTDDVIYFGFDLLYLDGFDLRSLDLLKRKILLSQLIKGRPKAMDSIRFSEHITGQGEAFFEKACTLNLEGIICKRAEAPYMAGRGRDWLKVKCIQRQEFVIGGFTEPQNSRQGFGSLLLGYYDKAKFVYSGRVGTGFTDASLIELRAKLAGQEQKQSPFVRPLAGIERRGAIHFVKPVLVCEVAFTGWTRDGALRHPAFQGLRLDKPATIITRERPKEVYEMTHHARQNAGAKKLPRRPTVLSKPPDRKNDDILGIKITHPDRIVFPGQGISKLDIALHYEKVAKWIMPYVINRPFSVVRCPQGQGEQCFFQRHVVPGVPEIFGEVQVQGRTARETYQYVKSPEGLIMLAQLGVLELHIWGSQADKVDRPDLMVLDLDPAPEVHWRRTVEGAKRARVILSELGLESYAKLSGGKGIHVVVPLTRNHTWPQVKDFAAAIARRMEAEKPDEFISTASKAKRVGKIYVDYLRNSREATSIAPFSTRARPGAPVAVPVTWEELTTRVRPDQFNIGNIMKRLNNLKGDPWEGFFDKPETITVAMKKEVEA